jgi:Tetracyclin repressor-like, C-terminal domain
MAPSPVARHQRTTSVPRRGRPRSPGVDQAILAATLRLLGEVGYAQLHALVRRRDPASTALPAIAGEAVRNPQLREVFRRAITAAVPAAVRTIVQRAIDRGALPPPATSSCWPRCPWRCCNTSAIIDQRPGTEVVDRIVAQFYTPTAYT